jgi:hypothetical protein
MDASWLETILPVREHYLIIIKKNNDYDSIFCIVFFFRDVYLRFIKAVLVKILRILWLGLLAHLINVFPLFRGVGSLIPRFMEKWI